MEGLVVLVVEWAAATAAMSSQRIGTSRKGPPPPSRGTLKKRGVSSDRPRLLLPPSEDDLKRFRVAGSNAQPSGGDYYDLDLAGFAMTGTFSIAFDAEMSSTGDYWFIDNMQVTGVRPPP